MKRITALMLIALALMLAACATVPTGQKADEHAAHQHAAATEQMHGNMQKMQEQMTKIHATADTAERQRLMAEHRSMMSEQMQSMHGMMAGEKGGMMGGEHALHQCPMMGHMEMMQSMMEQMLEHMSSEHGENPPANTDKKQ